MNLQATNSSVIDEEVRLVEQALRRAAQKARLLAAQTHTPLVVMREGQLQVEFVSSINDAYSKPSW